MAARPELGPTVQPDWDTIETFCEIVFGYATGFAPIRILPEKGGPDRKPLTPFEPANGRLASALFRHAEHAAETRTALYVVPGTVTEPGRAGARDIVQLTTVLVDLDHGDIEAKRAQLVDHLGAPSLEVASGGITDEGQTKRHLYWRLTEPAESEDLALVCRLRGAIAEKVCGDPAFGSAHQPVRVAGSVYGKHGSCRPVRILEHSMREVELAELAEAVLAMPVMPGCRDGAATTAGPGPKAAELLTRRIREGGLDEVTRFEAVSRIIGFWIRRAREGRCSLERAWHEVADHNLARIAPPFPEGEVRREFERLLRRDVDNHGPWPEDVPPDPGDAVSGDQTPKSVPPEASEDALADRFRLRHGSDWRYVALWGSWLGWDGVRWCKDETNSQLDLVRLVCREAAGGRDKAVEARRLASQKTIAAVERIARSDPALAARADDWDPDPMLLNTPGGIIDLSTGDLRPNDRAARMTSVAGASPCGACPRWSSFLSEITGGDEAFADYLRRVAGYLLTGDITEQVLFFFYGSGANGKSVFLNALMAVLGDYATTAPLDTFMAAQGERHPTDVAGLRGARMVSVAETEQGRRWAESKLKLVTGGDRVRARFMRQDFFEFAPRFKLVVIGNHKPAVRSVDEAMRRRLHLVPFVVTIPKAQRDQRLLETLLTEREGIMAWAVQGCLEWQRTGLAPPETITAATQEYFEEADVVGEWITECCRSDPSAFAPSKMLYSSWREFADMTGHPAGTKTSLTQDLVRRGYRQGRGRDGSRGVAGIVCKSKPSQTGAGQ